MSLTSLSAVKAFKNITGAEHDAELQRLIPVVGTFIAEYCGRLFERQPNVTEYHSTKSGQRLLLLQRPPVLGIVSLADDPARVYGAETELAASTYVIDDADAGIVRLDGVSFSSGLRNVKIVYDGGYQEIPSALEQAAIELVWLARDKGDQALLGLKSKSIADGSVSYLDNQWPSGVHAILDLYRFAR